jgi:hypothetical protein
MSSGDMWTNHEFLAFLGLLNSSKSINVLYWRKVPLQQKSLGQN